MINPPGQRFRKCDLHTHTPASRCYRFQDHTAAELVQSALEQGLDAIAVTDHNSGDWIDKMKEAAKDTELTVFPGVEVSMHENYHVVVLFDPTSTQKHVEGFLFAIGFTPEQFGRSEETCHKSIFEFCDIARGRNGLVILAHIDEIKGAYFQKREVEIDPVTGQQKITIPKTCSDLFNDAQYHAVEVVSGKLPEEFNSSRGFRRIPAFYQSSDNIDPEKPTKHSRFGYAKRHTWFSMAEISLEGLRQCFADPGVRIRQMHEFEPLVWPHIRQMKFDSNGFLAYQNFIFHPGLNCLIGHKGTGKSLVIESLRFALGQSSAEESLRKDHVGKLDKKIGVFSTVELEVVSRSGTAYKIVSRNEGNGRTSQTCTNLDTGEEYIGDLQTLLPILAYSQTEVIKIAEDEDAQLRLADTLIDALPHKQAIRRLQDKLGENDHLLAGALSARVALEDVRGEEATVQEELDGINRMLSSDLLSSMRIAERKDALYKSQEKYLSQMVNELEQAKLRLGNYSLPEIPTEFETDTNFQKNREDLLQASSTVQRQLQELLNGIAVYQNNVTARRDEWLPELKEVQEQYNTLLAGTDSARLELRRRELAKQLESTQQTLKSLEKQVVEELPRLLEERKTLLDALSSAHKEYFEVRQAKFDQLTAASDGKVRLRLAHAANREEYSVAISDLLKGGGAETISTANRQKIADNVSPRDLGELIIGRDVATLATQAQLTEVMAERVMDRFWSSDDFAEVLALQHAFFPADSPSIEFKKGREYAPISELSVGQKCTALLIIALCDGTMPVIIDQPEDALDIASVWQDVANKLRSKKYGRQFILTTHNSSLAVGSDSDTFFVLEPVGGTRAKVSVKGAIDQKPVRDAVIDNLEGGPNPYRLKHQKYNLSTD